MFLLMRESIPSSVGLMPQVMIGNNKLYSFHIPRMGMGLELFLYIHRPRFMAAYFNQPDNAAHKSGPDSDDVSGYYYTTLCQTK